ncbi:MFS transporter [Pseudoroseomonas wenyumeiae]|uniref:MFS transporter n=1 Tax=Teichococcus wenyumeiae TaxID=2478470 RepID=A0A3A9JF92_9PROT|nr:MFS transporter [Pseudoroseomonas wenyumeiae]RKK03215.1 MFS transporter [Pseudoroseomonas wenyumeiae]RMI15563.1 MFS transporter [Pseudoroseomonas wenyumeiae]
MLADSSATNRWQLLRWFISSATFSVPQAAGPITFSLVALSLTGDASRGAAIVLAMTLAQVAGAIPAARLGRNRPAATFLRLLVAIRTAALVLIATLAAGGAPFIWLILAAAIGGSVNGAAHGYLRSVLNALTPAERLPRALGVAATLNELTFVVAPVAASGLGSVSPVFAVLALAGLGAVPILLVPQSRAAPIDGMLHAGGSVLSPPILLWLLCSLAGGAAVAAIEIGAVALALRFGYEPALAFLFTVPLCVASVAGGVWVSLRNRMATRKGVLIQLSIMTLGAAFVALEQSVATTVVGAVLVGSVLAPLGTYYSLILDTLAPPQRRTEVFALLRTANSSGVIFASAILTIASLSATLIGVAGLMFLATSAVAFATYRRQSRPSRV